METHIIIHRKSEYMFTDDTESNSHHNDEDIWTSCYGLHTCLKNLCKDSLATLEVLFPAEFFLMTPRSFLLTLEARLGTIKELLPTLEASMNP